ncbi:DUF488 domain-containing protein [Moheibacter sp.]|uniref:DUF488 domain-containing protein n=1 Tax=Moheibacter sp. TaxID=1965316 RepID=UPI003C73F40E
MKSVQIKRIYEEASPEDGFRMLVDRIWPRGISKERAKLDEWNKEIAPSTELRKWFDHKMEKFEEFKLLYSKELESKKENLNRMKEIAQKGNLTLLYAAKDTEMNQAVLLRDLILKD